jgi:hypothetical protein
METESNARPELVSSQITTPNITQRLLERLAFLLSDAESDISVAARDLGLVDANYVRLLRAQDRVGCAQRLLETMRQAISKTMRAAAQADDEDNKSLGAIASAMRAEVELLASEWPEESIQPGLVWNGWYSKRRSTSNGARAPELDSTSRAGSAGGWKGRPLTGGFCQSKPPTSGTSREI